MTPEVWKPVADYPDYEVSNLGRLRRYVYGHHDCDGYIKVSGGKRGSKVFHIHVEVARAFLGPKPVGEIVRHLNDDRRNNSVENLAYGTRKDNAEDARRNGRDAYLTAPENLARLKKVCVQGGLWWRGKKRDGQRGKVRT